MPKHGPEILGSELGNGGREQTRGTVLVVDDNPDDARLAVRTIGKLFPQLATRVVPSGEDMIFYVLGKHDFSERAAFPYPILVLLDLNMTGMNGFDALLWLRDHPPHHFVPVIVLTGAGETEHAGRAYALGARSFLAKPLRRNDLENAVRGLQDWLELVRIPASVTSR